MWEGQLISSNVRQVTLSVTAFGELCHASGITRHNMYCTSQQKRCKIPTITQYVTVASRLGVWRSVCGSYVTFVDEKRSDILWDILDDINLDKTQKTHTHTHAHSDSKNASKNTAKAFLFARDHSWPVPGFSFLKN